MKVFNLAEELEKERKKNKELEEKIKHYEKTITFGDYVEELNTLIDYKYRIDKAIEYMKEYCDIIETDKGYFIRSELTLYGLGDLLNILKGSDNNE